MLVFSNHFYKPIFFPNLAIVVLIYFSLYMDFFSGVLISYIIFYIYGSVTALNSSTFALIGVITFVVAFYLWKKLLTDNIFHEFLITFLSSLVYYMIFFLLIYYFFKFKYNFIDFFLFYLFPVSLTTSVVSPLVFYIFKKIDSSSLKKKREITV